MTDVQASRNIRLYYLQAIFGESLLLGIITVDLYTGLTGISLAEIFYMQAALHALSAVLEVPAGAISDIFGRRRTLIAARIIYGVGSILFMAMSSPIHLWTAGILMAVGGCLQSGTDTSLLYETLKEKGRESEYARILGAAVGWRLKIKGVCALSVGVLAAIDLRLPLLIGVPLTFLPLVGSFFYTEPTRVIAHGLENRFSDLKRGIVATHENVHVRWIVAFSAFLGVSGSLWYWYNPYYGLIGVSTAWLGVIGFSTNFIAGITSRYAYRIKEKFSERFCMLVVSASQGATLLASAAHPFMTSIALIVPRSFAEGLSGPITSAYLNHRIASVARNTVLSIQSALANAATIVTSLVFGLSIDAIGFLNSAMIFGAILSVCGCMFFLAYLRQPKV